MANFLTYLKQRLWFLEDRWFARLSWVAAIIAPLPLSIQLYKALTASTVEGVAIEAYAMLSLLHLVLLGRGVKNLDSRLVTNFTLTSSISAAIAITAILRGGKFILF